MNSKNFLYILIIISLTVCFWSAKEIYSKINLHLYGDSIEIRPKTQPIKAQLEKDQQAQPQQISQVKQESSEIIQVEEKLPETSIFQNESKANKQKAIKISFKYKNKKAKKVLLSASFIKWKEKPMRHKDGIWETEEFVLPGNYFYHFVVDGKKTLDPQAPKTPLGESLITVK